MFQSATPIAFFQQHAALVQSHLPGILDGCVSSIHDARIATRRVREVLPLTHEWLTRRDADDFSARIKELGRSLGTARDADIRIELLRYFEARLPEAAASLVPVRQQQQRDRLRVARKLIKRVEQLEVAGELARMSRVAARQRRGLWIAFAGAWRHQLRLLLAERAQEAGAALVHASGVYFPNRAHAARIAIKKFRYAAEISAQAGLLVDQPLLRTLKRAQDLLGDIHDRQTLVDELAHLASTPDGVDARRIASVAAVAEAEIADLYGRVLARRAEVLEACLRTRHALDERVLLKGACAIAGMVALAAGVEATRRHPRSRLATGDVEQATTAVSVRVPVILPEASTR